MSYPRPRANRAVYDEHWRQWKLKFGVKRQRVTPPPSHVLKPIEPSKEVELEDLTDDHDVDTSAE
jgi:hypothetical protein